MEFDRAYAEAIKIAHEEKKNSGWKFTASDIGKYAAEIMKSLKRNMED